MTTEIEFNINQNVKVKLKPLGMIHLCNTHKKITSKYGDYVPRVDADGYYKTQLWSLMQDFGDVMSLSSGSDYFGTVIILQLPTEDKNQ